MNSYKKYYIAAIAAFALIPMVTVLGGILLNLINPEIAAGHANYVRNYWLLDVLKRVLFFGMLLVDLALWFLTGFFLLKAKQQSYQWLPLVLLGPLGFAVLTTLGDRALEQRDFYHCFVSKLNIYLRVAYELCSFWIFWELAYQAMVLKRNLMIIYEAAATGVSTAEIIAQQDASSGMWAFGEGLEVMFLVVVFYLLRPLVFNAVGRLCGLWTSRDQA